MSLVAPPPQHAAEGDAPRSAVTRGLVLSVSLGTVLNPINSSMLAVALVPIAHYFGVSVVTASWLVSALYITTAVAQPTWGRLCDAGHSRSVFLIGSALVALAGAMAPFAPNIAFLIFVRVLLGLGTAAGYPSALASIRRAAERGDGKIPNGSLATISFAAQATNAFGPALGGVLVTLGGWKWVFLFNLPFVAITWTLGYLYIPRDHERAGHQRGWRRLLPGTAAPMAVDDRPGTQAPEPSITIRDLDPFGIVLFAAATGFSVAALLNVQANPLTLLTLVAAAVVSSVGFVRWERHTTRPFIPLKLFAANRALTGTYVRVLVFNTIFYAIYYGWPIWLERGRGLDPSTAGLVTLPVATVGAFATMAAARISRGRGPRRALIVGAASLVVATLAMFGLTSYTSIPLLMAVAALFGIPNGFSSVGNQLATYQQAPMSMAGMAAGLQRSSSYIGANIASAMVGLTVSANTAKGQSGPLHVLAAILAAGAVGLLVRAVANRSLSAATVAHD